MNISIPTMSFKSITIPKFNLPKLSMPKFIKDRQYTKACRAEADAHYALEIEARLTRLEERMKNW